MRARHSLPLQLSPQGPWSPTLNMNTTKGERGAGAGGLLMGHASPPSKSQSKVPQKPNVQETGVALQLGDIGTPHQFGGDFLQWASGPGVRTGERAG